MPSGIICIIGDKIPGRMICLVGNEIHRGDKILSW